jgi:hypothetical protein
LLGDGESAKKPWLRAPKEEFAMIVEKLLTAGSKTICTGLVVLQALTGSAASAQGQEPSVPAGVVLGEDPRIRELGPPTEFPRLQALATGAEYRLQVIYMIPGNRTPQPGAEQTLQDFVIRMQAWFRDHTERIGYAPKTFAYETEDGSTPTIHVAYVEQPDYYFHDDYVQRWSKVLNRLTAAGFPMWHDGTLTLVIAEMHVQEPDGRLRETSIFFGGAGTSTSGVAMVTGETLARMSQSFLTDDRPYHGLVIPEIGPYPLVQNVSFAWYEGTTISSVSSSAQGGAMHELGHGVNLWHDFRNDRNFNGNLMGNGFRGLRGSLFPNLYPPETVGLTTGSALMLDNSRFFNPQQEITENIPPATQILTSGTAPLVRGLCEVTYSTADANSLLGGALLIRAGQVVADISLDGASSSGTISTYDYTPGVEEEWNLVAIDRQGNRAVSPAARLRCASGVNRAPVPNIHVITTTVGTGEELSLDATESFDPDGSVAGLTVRWDMDGDGTFDTSPTTSKTETITYSRPGLYRVVAELTDEIGDSSLSVPIGIRVEQREVPEVPVGIDIKPGDDKNHLNPRSHGGLWVAVLSGADFNPLAIDVDTIRFGRGGAAVLRGSIRDVNGDGVLDLVLRFGMAESQIRCGDTAATLTGTVNGLSFTGSDVIWTVGCKAK